MKNKIMFFLLNYLLVIFVGLSIGLIFKDNIFDNTTNTFSYIILLLVLSSVSIVYMINKSINLGGKICISFFIAIEVVLNILFMCINVNTIKIYAIIQMVVVVLFLIGLIINISFFGNDEK